MAVVWILSLLFFVGSVSTEDSTLSNHPSVVQVEFLLEMGVWGQNCVASILNARNLLSAKSCFTETSVSTSRIRAGAYFRNNGGVILYVERAINYERENSTSDISVIRLASFLNYGPLIRQTAIPAPTFNLQENQPMIQAGWSRNDYPSSGLFASRIAIVSIGQCGIEPSEAAISQLHCARYTRTSEIPNVQAGGPWLINNITVAVASGRNGEGSWPSVSGTAVAPFTEWIVSVAT